MKKTRVVILGGGFGGVYTAHNLISSKRFRRRMEVTLISRNPNFEFKPLFPEVLGGRLSPEAVQFPLIDLLERDNCNVEIAEVTEIDPGKCIVRTAKDRFHFDYLVIALGGAPERMPMSKRASVFSMESLDDCVKLRDRIPELSASSGRAEKARNRARISIAIVGAGPTGVETALEIWDLLNKDRDNGRTGSQQISVNIHLIESASEILPGWGVRLRDRTEEKLAQTDINVHTGVTVNRIGKGRIYSSNGHAISADTIVFAGGLRGLPLYRSLGHSIDRKDRLRVDSSLNLLRHPDIFAMGDSINTDSLETLVPQSAQAAHQQARVVSANILNSTEARELQEFHYADMGEMMTVGGRRAIARIFGLPLDGYSAWALEKALFMVRIPGVKNKLKLFNEIALEPLVRKGEEYLEARHA